MDRTDLQLRAPAWIPEGRQDEILDLLHLLDQYNMITFDDLLHGIPGHEGRVADELRKASWKAREILAPDLLPAGGPPRMLISEVDLRDYQTVSLFSSTVGQVQACVLVSSEREDGSHSPALDLDYPAAVYLDGDGNRYLHILPDSPAIRYHGPEAVEWADAAMAAVGLHRTARPERTVLYDTSIHGQIAASLGSGWGGCFGSLQETATAIDTPDLKEPVQGGYWYEVDGVALIVPSTSWYHLYTDKVVDADSYISAVDALAGCGLLNPGFANGARDRGFTSLRRPGLMKPPPVSRDPMDPDDIPF